MSKMSRLLNVVSLLAICLPAVTPHMNWGWGRRMPRQLYRECDEIVPPQVYEQQLTYTNRSDISCCSMLELRDSCCLINSNSDEEPQCKCDPTVDCGNELTGRSAPSRSLCSKSRVLNGEVVENSCVFSGIAGIYSFTSRRMMCNAVLTEAYVDGEFQKTFMTIELCTDSIKILKESGKLFNIKIGPSQIPIADTILSISDGDNGLSFLTVTPEYSYALDNIGCQTTSCPYNEETMEDDVDLNDCVMVSYGSSNKDLQQNGLNKVPVEHDPEGCNDIPDMFGADNTMCFRSVSGSNLVCSNDMGAPVYCRASSNNELILMGVTSFQTECNRRPTIKVIPVPV